MPSSVPILLMLVCLFTTVVGKYLRKLVFFFFSKSMFFDEYEYIFDDVMFD